MLSGIGFASGQCGTCTTGTCGAPVVAAPTCGTAVAAPVVAAPIVASTCGTTCGPPPAPACEPPRPSIPDPIKGEIFEITRVEKKPIDVIIERVSIKPETKKIPCLTEWGTYIHTACPKHTVWNDKTRFCEDAGFGWHEEVVKKVDWFVQLVKHEVEFVVPLRVVKNVEWSSARPFYSKDVVINLKPTIDNRKTKVIVNYDPPVPAPPVPPAPPPSVRQEATCGSRVVSNSVVKPAEQPAPIVQQVPVPVQVQPAPVVQVAPSCSTGSCAAPVAAAPATCGTCGA